MLLDQIHAQFPHRPTSIRQAHGLWGLLGQLRNLGFLLGRHATGHTTPAQLRDGFQVQLLEGVQIFIHGVRMYALRLCNFQRTQSHPLQRQAIRPPSLMWIGQFLDAFAQLLNFSRRWTTNFHLTCHDNTSLNQGCHSNSNLWSNSHINLWSLRLTESRQRE